MQVGSITPNPIISPPVQQNRRAQDFQAIAQALQSGDLPGAEQGFAQFKKDFHAAHGRNLGQTNVPSAIQDDFRALQAAFDSGDLSSAQGAFQKLKDDFQQGPHPQPTVSDSIAAMAGSGSKVNVVA
jgi:hypothetical protein